MLVITKDFDISEQNATTSDKEGESGRGGGGVGERKWQRNSDWKAEIIDGA